MPGRARFVAKPPGPQRTFCSYGRHSALAAGATGRSAVRIALARSVARRGAAGLWAAGAAEPAGEGGPCLQSISCLSGVRRAAQCRGSCSSARNAGLSEFDKHNAAGAERAERAQLISPFSFFQSHTPAHASEHIDCHCVGCQLKSWK